MEIRQANIADLDLLVPLFDGYLQFYSQTSDVERARSFLQERLQRCGGPVRNGKAGSGIRFFVFTSWRFSVSLPVQMTTTCRNLIA